MGYTVSAFLFLGRGVRKKSSFSLIYAPKSRRKKKLRLKMFGLFLFKGRFYFSLYFLEYLCGFY